MPPQLDPSWQPLLAFVGAVLGVIFTFLGIRTTAKANTKMKEIDAAGEIIKEYRAMKDEIKVDADAREQRMQAEFEKKLSNERQERLEFEDKMTTQLDEVIGNFGVYVKWARGGAVPPPPFIPEWIYSKISHLFENK